MNVAQFKIKILESIGYTEPSTFGEFCGALGKHKPEDSGEWRTLFICVDQMERDELIEVERDRSNKIESLQLTEEGKSFLENSK